MGSVALGRFGPRARSPRDVAAWAARWLVFWLAVLLVARQVATMVEPLPVVAFVPALFLSVALLSARFPALVLLVLALFTGFYGTINATTGIERHLVVQGLLAGLWLAALHGLITRRGDLSPRLWPGAVLLLVVVGVSLCWAVLADSLTQGFGGWRNRYWLMLAPLLVAYLPPGRVSSKAIGRAFLIAGAAGSGYAVLRWQIGPSGLEREHALATAGPYTFLEGELLVCGLDPPDRQEWSLGDVCPLILNHFGVPLGP